MKVLYIHQAGTFGGASRSLLEVLNNLKDEDLNPVVASPPGSFVSILDKLNIPHLKIGGVSLFDHTNIGYYQKMRWFILMREFTNFFPTIWFFIKNRKTIRQVDIIHINEITLVLPLIVAKKYFKKPVVLHARTPFYNKPGMYRTKWLIGIFNKYADRVIAIDYTVARSLQGVNNIQVIHNGFSYENKFQKVDENLVEKLSIVRRRAINLGFLGAIIPTKGIFELLEAVKMAVDSGLDVNLIIVGNGNPIRKSFINSVLKTFGITYDGNEHLQSFIAKNKLEQHIYPLGFTTNTKEFFQYIDIICFPSYFDAVGRPVFEAAFYKKPSLLTIKDPLPDTFIPDETGIQVETNEPLTLLGAIQKIFKLSDRLPKLGENAHSLAMQNFDGVKNAQCVYELYKGLIAEYESL